MSYPEKTLFGAALALFILSILIAWATNRTRLTVSLLSTGLCLQLASIVIRWVDIGHPPIFGTYEAALQGSWFLALFIMLSHWSLHGHFQGMVRTGVPMVVLMLLYGLSFSTERIPLTISERSLWVDFHALFSWLAFAPFMLAFCLSAALLFSPSNGERERVRSVSSWPERVIMDELAFRYINFGFINHTIMFALGCYYSSILYGTWWQWDPAESTSLITWLSVALYIHMRLFYNWKETKAAWLFAAIFFTVIFSYWGLIYLPSGSTFHVFDIEFKAH